MLRGLGARRSGFWRSHESTGISRRCRLLAMAAKAVSFAATQTASSIRSLPRVGRARDFPSVSARDLHELGGDASARHASPPRRSKKASTIACTAPAQGAPTSAPTKQEELKKRFGALINANATEIAFTANTSDGENIVVMGLDLAEAEAATSSSTSCTSRPRSTCTRSSRRRASSSASSSTATGRSIRKTWTRRSTGTRGWCRWRWCRTSTASCTTARR